MDTKQQHSPTTSPDDWYTPRWIIDTLGPFDLDPCAAPESVRPFPTATTMLTRQEDGLAHEWHGTVWMNPPYSRALLRQFCERMARHGDGIALLVNRQDNLLWQEVIFPTAASASSVPTAPPAHPSSAPASWPGARRATAACASRASRASMWC